MTNEASRSSNAMDIQTIRRHNLGHVLSAFEMAGISCAPEQAYALANIVTPHKLVKMLLASHIDTLVARGVECATGLPKGWMDEIHLVPDFVPIRENYRLSSTAQPSEWPAPMTESKDAMETHLACESAMWESRMPGGVLSDKGMPSQDSRQTPPPA
ncbi:hypothetical protein L2Y96_19095 [Luteibacter aegosomaticola]|uniref:hypothetical protein n=1 Tax=Luteibacter aegosomaticola TaxID=2911538 RepID=UPI001FF7945E|nr:hypothetical protein [Luteibacter aegosomaticola]UPG89479.1 hypothetical protein L2Y96_19095 [Luteibacter aegosomaticola]